MNKNKLIKKSFIALYKMLLYAVLLTTFILPYGLRYAGLTFISRTFIITCGSFSIVMFLMMNVYGNFEIGEKKSKPVVFSTFMNIVITDIATLFALKVMAYHDNRLLSMDILILILIILVQYFAIYVFTYLGNYLYFEMFNPIRVAILHNDSEDLPKLMEFFNRHAKQFEILKIENTDNVSNCNLDNIQQVYLLNMPYDQLLGLCTDNFMSDLDVFYDADIYNALGGSHSKTVIDDILIYEFSSEKISMYQLVIKRLMDIVVSIFALIFFIPVFLVVAVAIKLDDKGPVFYLQKRVTRNGEIFEIIKFRSMKVNSGYHPATKDDDRITKVGVFIRRFRLDEIPQFLNILKGDMSVVGPRPESENLNNQITAKLPEFKYRLKLKAGLTGYAQIFGRYNTSSKKKLLLDLEYIENYSLLQDVKLIFQTIIVFVKKDSTEGFDNNEDRLH